MSSAAGADDAVELSGPESLADMTAFQRDILRVLDLENHQKGLSIKEKLAEYCNLSPEYISHIERGKASPSFDVIAGLARELDIEPRSLFDFTDLELRS